jgi:hypothetical protein
VSDPYHDIEFGSAFAGEEKAVSGLTDDRRTRPDYIAQLERENREQAKLIAALETLIEAAPHYPVCPSLSLYGRRIRCECWKSRALRKLRKAKRDQSSSSL